MFKIKENGKYKARLVVRGFEQKSEIDLTDIYSPVVESASIRLIFTVAAAKTIILRVLMLKPLFCTAS